MSVSTTGLNTEELDERRLVFDGLGVSRGSTGTTKDELDRTC